MIKSFQDHEPGSLFHGQKPRKYPPDNWRRGPRKLLIHQAAAELSQLRVPPANWLEKSKGDRSSQHSIRINDQWRICFQWRDGNINQVEITDYHS